MTVWPAAAVLAILCAICGFYLHTALRDYNNLQNDINRQLNRMDALQTEENQPAAQPADTRGVPETMASISSRMAGFNLSEQSLQSEVNNLDLNGWDEWHIEAVCTGTADNLGAFIDSLETSGMYHDEKFTVDLNDEDLYELNIELSFYERHE